MAITSRLTSILRVFGNMPRADIGEKAVTNRVDATTSLDDKELWKLAFVTFIGAILRFIHLNSDLWLDEVVALVTYFRLPPHLVFVSYESPNQHLLYSMMASLSISTFGESAWSVRLPSALIGTATIPAIYWLATTISSTRVALLSAVFLAFSYHHIWFSQSARGYSGMVLCSTLGTALLLAARTSESKRVWLVYAVLMACGVAFLQSAVFVLIGHLVAIAVVDRRIRAIHLLATLGSFALALLAHAGILNKIAEFWMTEERTGWGSGISSLSGLVGLFSGGLEKGFLIPGAIVVVSISAWSWLHLWKSDRLIAVLFIAPSLIGFGAVILLHYGAYPRAFLHALPFVFVMISHLALSENNRLTASLVTILLLCSVASLVYLYRYPKQDYSGALQSVLARVGAGDRIAGAGMAAGVYQLYYAPHLPAVRTLAELRSLEAGIVGNVWVIFSFTRDMRLRFPQLYDYMETNYETVSTHPGTLDDGTIFVVRRGASQGRQKPAL